MISRRAALAGGLALATVPIWASRAPAMPLPPLRVGVLVDLSGPLARLGKQIQTGIGYRAEAINSAGGHGGGSQVELLMADAAKGERDAVAGLIEQGVHVLIGGGQWLAGMGEAACTPTILTSGTAEGRYVFQAGPSAAQVTQKQLHAVKGASLTSAGHLSAAAADAKAFAAQGIQLAGAQLVPLDATSLAPQAAAVIAEQPESVIVNAPPPLEALAVKELRAAGWTGPIVASPSATDPAFHTAAGEAAEGVMAVSPWLPAQTQAPETLPYFATMRRFAEGYSVAHGRPGSHAGFAADALSLVHLAYLGHRDRKMAQAQLDQMCCVGVCGVYNMSATKHAGLDPDALTLLVSKDAIWTADPG